MHTDSAKCFERSFGILFWQKSIDILEWCVISSSMVLVRESFLWIFVNDEKHDIYSLWYWRRLKKRWWPINQTFALLFGVFGLTIRSTLPVFLSDLPKNIWWRLYLRIDEMGIECDPSISSRCYDHSRTLLFLWFILSRVNVPVFSFCFDRVRILKYSHSDLNTIRPRLF